MPKFTIELNRTLIDHVAGTDGKVSLVPTSTILAHQLAHLLNSSGQGDHVKFTDWADDLLGSGTIEVDASDLETLKQFVRSHPGCPALLKRQILEVMEISKPSKPLSVPPVQYHDDQIA